MAKNLAFRPRLLDALQGYNRAKLVRDVSAGMTVGVVALPLAMAFAIASGLKPEAGIITAIVAGFLISALGGSSVQIGGPAGAYIVIVFGIVARYGVANLLLATMLAGLLLLLMGLCRLGNLIRFIPVSIVIGFTNGIAVLIALSQVKEFFGLRMDSMPAEFFAKIKAIAEHAHSWDPSTVIVASLSLLILILWPRLSGWLGKIPGPMVALAFGTLAVSQGHLSIETIGTRFGGIPQALPSFAFPAFDWSSVQYLFAPTITIALLGAIESLLCARVADTMIQERHDPNQELMAQGIANIAAPLFGGFCATGTIARTVTNVRSGALTPIAGIVHAITLLFIVLLAAPWAKHVPLACLAAILMFMAYNMGDWHEFSRLRQFSMNYRTVLLSTFLLTVMIDLTVAVEVGLALACLFFIVRVSALTRVERLSDDEVTKLGMESLAVEVYHVSGSLFFAAVGKLEALLDPLRPAAAIVILDLTQTLNIDTTGLEALENVHSLLSSKGSSLVLCGLQPQALSLLERSGFSARLGPHRIFQTLQAACQALNT